MLNAALAVETVLCMLFVYLPSLNVVLKTVPPKLGSY